MAIDRSSDKDLSKLAGSLLCSPYLFLKIVAQYFWCDYPRGCVTQCVLLFLSRSHFGDLTLCC